MLARLRLFPFHLRFGQNSSKQVDLEPVTTTPSKGELLQVEVEMLEAIRREIAS